MDQVKLGHDGRWAALRELNGRDEQSLSGVGALDAIGLLDRVIVNASGAAVSPGQAATLTAAERDRLLAAMYLRAFGDGVSATARCSGCGTDFDMDFSLAGLRAELGNGSMPNDIERCPDGSFRLTDGRRFRLPTGEDECAVFGLPAEKAEQELLRRCVLESDPAQDTDSLLEVMSTAAPLLEADLDAKCPGCGKENTFHFNIQSFLLASLLQEQKRLAGEVQVLARAYGWGLTEILELPRTARRVHVSALEVET